MLSGGLAASAQFTLQVSGTTASLRGIQAVDARVAWASGSQGTILHTTDGGVTWLRCTTPAGAEKFDFRGIQGFDASTAIAMSIGKGDMSRLYKTTDGCRTWTLILTNPDGPDDGFFDALLFLDRNLGFVFGDPAHGGQRNPAEGGYFAFRIRVTHDGGKTWAPISDPERSAPGTNLQPAGTEGLFAASNSSAAMAGSYLLIGTGGGRILRRRLYETEEAKPFAFQSMHCGGALDPISGGCGIPWVDWTTMKTPLAAEGAGAGIFSLAFRSPLVGLAVGGDYGKATQATANAAYTTDGGVTWLAAKTPPGGYRSSVVYDAVSRAWIATGPTGFRRLPGRRPDLAGADAERCGRTRRGQELERAVAAVRRRIQGTHRQTQSGGPPGNTGQTVTASGLKETQAIENRVGLRTVHVRPLGPLQANGAAILLQVGCGGRIVPRGFVQGP